MSPFGMAFNQFVRKNFPNEAGWTAEVIRRSFHAGWSAAQKQKLEESAAGGAGAQGPKVPGRSRCEDCKHEIDPDWCWCGDAMADHKGMSHNHSPVPMGCTCGMRLPPRMSEPSSPDQLSGDGHV